MSLAPAAPPLAAGVLFHRAAPSAFDALPFRAKTNPFNYGSTGGGGDGGSSQHHTLSPPPSGSARSASSSASAASGSPDAQAPWKVHLKQQCMQRVKANRSSLVQKMRSAVEAHSPPPLNALTAAQAASASDALSQSLRGIIEDQFISQRNQAAAAAAAGQRSPGASYTRASHAYFGDGCTADDAFSYTASDCEGGLSQDELIELLAQLEEEVRRGDDSSQSHSQQLDGSQFGMNDAPQPSSHIPLAATSAASASSASAAAAASPFGFGVSAFGSPFMQQQQQQQQQHQLAAAYDAEAAAQMEADLLALQEYESVQSAQRVPCPVCHDPNVTVSSGSSVGSGCASCPRCGLRYSVSSVDEFRQHLSDACELHMHKCAAAPKFMTQHYGDAGRAAGAAAAAASASSTPAAASSSLALVCEVCQTWLTLPVPSNGFASHPSSQNPAADDDDDQPMAS